MEATEQKVFKTKEEYNPDLIEAYRAGEILSIRASTWAINRKVTKDSFANRFKRNPRVALRDYASIPAGTVQDFCHDKTLYSRRLMASSRIRPYDERGAYYEWFKPGPWLYYLHGDLGETRDSAGFCMSHLDKVRNKVVIDCMISLKPEPGLPLRFSRMQQTVLELRKLGFELAKVTYDRWQSRETMQRLNEKGIKTEWFSVDKDTRAYDTFYDLLLSDGVEGYYEPLFEEEWNHLLLIGGKVDHPEGGSKDLADAVVAACFHCVEAGYKETTDVPIEAVPVYPGLESPNMQTFEYNAKNQLVPRNVVPAGTMPQEEERETDDSQSAVLFERADL